MDRQRYPVGIQTFSEIREKGFLYIDKTRFIQQMLEGSKYYLLCRPRRFGKSLLLSTIEAFFAGRRDLFEGLDISRHDHDWISHPVFHLDLVNFNTESREGFESMLEARLSHWEKDYGISSSGNDFAQRFQNIIQRSAKMTGQQAVILVDEYDKPLVNTLHDSALNETFRQILRPIYACLKAADRHISFAMLTGVTRFSRLSIFSDINNLFDISLDPRFDAICGITEQEMTDTCRPGIENLAKAYGIAYRDGLSLLKKNYDGYHFTHPSPDIYNPFSLLSALDSSRINPYWFGTGTPTFLIEALRSRHSDIRRLLDTESSEYELSEVEAISSNTTSLLFQTGYLTIKGIDRETGDYRLGIPNLEVEQGLFRGMLPIFSGTPGEDSSEFIRSLSAFLKEGDPENALEILRSFLADIPYHLSGNKPEIYFENNLYIIFKMLGFRASTEYTTSAGRIDILVKTGDFVYIMELKLDGTPHQALDQIMDKGYYLPFLGSGKKIVCIGINFSKKARNIDQWIITSV